ncbi:MAG: UDP-N-acetylmuramate dehydrogenase [Rhodospirillales bacterium]|nr:UDP-N-acetylmuramate dehydrogenase [Rhodospirillales bacterium]MBO6787229.1 UDP-N-acetylmuramate dehydrogenase [Rhodospirillales bacterium]
MMAAERHAPHLIDRMPPVRGRLRADEPLAKYTWFRVGGPAEVLFEPADMDDLTSFMANRPGGVDVTVIGGTSNILVRDGGVPGVVIRLGKPFATIETDGVSVRAGAAAADINVARRAAEAGIAGLEFMVGIPGTLGGALRMNAGAYGTEIADVFESAEAIDGHGQVHTLSAADMGFAYRHTDVPDDFIFTGAVLKGTAGDADAILDRMKDIQDQREASQPVRERTGGSTFANPDGAKAWELIDKAGCRGLTIGGAQVSPAHTNFLINTGNASAGDLESLGEEVRRRVMDKFGIELRWEIRRLGKTITNGPEEVQP